ncbi:MAG TPA: tetratricopeptide repeat protein [Rhodospirillales bacterium]|jgi:lipoprotein NlpI
MSLILEALKKSEKERQGKADTGSAAAATPAGGQAALPSRWRMAAGVLAFTVVGLAIGGGVGFFELLPGSEVRAPVKHPPIEGASATPAAKQTTEPAAPKPASPVPRPQRAALPEVLPPTPAASEPAAMAAATMLEPSVSKPVQAAAPAPSAAIVAPAPAVEAARPSIVATSNAPSEPATPATTANETQAAQQGRLATVVVPKKPAAPFAARALQFGNTEAQVLARRGRGYEDKGLHEQAIDTYSQAVALDPGFADAYFGRGWARLAKGAYGDAAQDFQRMIALRPDAADAYFGRAWALEQQGDGEQAIRQYGEAIRLQPSHADAHFSRGVLEFMAGRMEAAARDFSAVHENANTVGDLGDYARLWHHVAEARAGGTSATALIGWQGKGPWPEVLAKLFRGEATTEQVLVAAKSKDARKQRENECIAFFFLAQHRLVNGDLNGAVGYFRRTLATGVTHFRQYAAARAELGRLDKAN